MPLGVRMRSVLLFYPILTDLSVTKQKQEQKALEED